MGEVDETLKAAPFPDDPGGGGEHPGEDDITDKSSTLVSYYPNGYVGSLDVYIRSVKALNHIKISQQLFLAFKSVSSIIKINSFKLKVTFKNREEANSLPLLPGLVDCRVYIPAKAVQIDGIINCEPEDDLPSLGKDGYGISGDSALGPRIKLLSVFRLNRAVPGEDITYVPSNSVRVTFEGTVLPKYLIFGCLRLPIRRFIPKVMTCSSCLQLNHTAKFCNNRPRCKSCGTIHTGECQTKTFQCPNCKGIFPEATHECKTYERAQRNVRRLPLSIGGENSEPLTLSNRFSALDESGVENGDSWVANDSVLPNRAHQRMKRSRGQRSPNQSSTVHNPDDINFPLLPQAQATGISPPPKRRLNNNYRHSQQPDYLTTIGASSTPQSDQKFSLMPLLKSIVTQVLDYFRVPTPIATFILDTILSCVGNWISHTQPTSQKHNSNNSQHD